MKPSFLSLFTLAALVPASLLAADPKEAVTAALKKLADAPNYSWTSKSEMAGGGGGGGNAPAPVPVEGKANKDGFACITMKRDDNTTEVVIKGDKGVLKTPEGWKKADDLPAPTAGGGGGGGGGARGGGGAFMGRMLMRSKTPAAEAADLLTKVKELKEADGAISGDLTEEAVKALSTFGRRRPNADANAPGPEIKNAKGSVKFTLKDGAITGYVLHTESDMSFNGNDRHNGRTQTVTISEVGTTKIEVPADAKKALE